MIHMLIHCCLVISPTPAPERFKPGHKAGTVDERNNAKRDHVNSMAVTSIRLYLLGVNKLIPCGFIPRTSIALC